MLRIRRASNDDRKLILYTIEEAADWLRTKDTDQWAKPWPSEPERNARVERGLLEGRTWIVEEDGIFAATITCRPHANNELWTGRERQDSAVYVSRLVVSRDHAGQGIGAELVNWAGWLAAQQFGARWIRIDVWTTNIALHNYYRRNGFLFVRFSDKVGYPSTALFQKPTASITVTDIPRLTDRPDLV
jgi:GNAT superfamily N-acetyltransferase